MKSLEMLVGKINVNDLLCNPEYTVSAFVIAADEHFHTCVDNLYFIMTCD